MLKYQGFGSIDDPRFSLFTKVLQNTLADGHFLRSLSS